jgi:outer membrane protein TolC
VQIQISILNYQIALAEAEAAKNDFESMLIIHPSLKQDTKLPNSLLDNEVVQESTTTASLGLKRKFLTGGTGELVYQELKVVTDSQQVTLPDSTRSAFQVKWTQPLMKDYGPESATSRIKKARLKVVRYWYDLLNTINQEIQESQMHYWDLYKSYGQVRNDQSSLNLAKENFEEVAARLDSGFATAVDLEQSRAKLALAEASIYSSQINLDNSEADLLKKMWDVKEDPLDFHIVPQPKEIIPSLSSHLPAFKGETLSRYRKMEIEVEERNFDVILSKNGLRPQLDLGLQYGLAGLGVNPDSAHDQALQLSYPSWQVTLSLSFPLENFTGKGEQHRSLASLRTQEIKIEKEKKNLQSKYQTSLKEFGKKMQSLEILKSRMKIEDELFKMKQKAFLQGSYPWKKYSEAIDSLNDLKSQWNEQITQVNREAIELMAAAGPLAKEASLDFLKRRSITAPKF